MSVSLVLLILGKSWFRLLTKNCKKRGVGFEGQVPRQIGVGIRLEGVVRCIRGGEWTDNDRFADGVEEERERLTTGETMHCKRWPCKKR